MTSHCFRGVGFTALLVGGLLLPPTLARAADETASTVASKLVEGIRVEYPKQLPAVLLMPIEGADRDETTAMFAAALTHALVSEQKLEVLDRKAVIAALDEAALNAATGEKEMSDIAGALGAKVLLSGRIQPAGKGYVANFRAVSVTTGAVLAAADATIAAEGVSPVEAHTLEAQLRRLADRINDGLQKLDGDLRYQYVAVMPFEEVGSTTQEKQLGLLVSAELSTFLRRDHGLLLVERTRFAALMDEMALGQSGAVDPTKAAEVGKLAGAQALVIGSVAEAGDRYLVDARVVSVADGQVRLAEQAKLPAADLVALSSEAVVLRTRSGAIYRSLVLPGWGQFYNREAAKGVVFVGTEVLAGGLALTFHLLAKDAETSYRKMRAGDFDAAFDKMESRRTWRDVFLWSLLAVHLVNVVDAAFFGKSFDSATVTPGAGSVQLRY